MTLPSARSGRRRCRPASTQRANTSARGGEQLGDLALASIASTLPALPVPTTHDSPSLPLPRGPRGEQEGLGTAASRSAGGELDAPQGVDAPPEEVPARKALWLWARKIFTLGGGQPGSQDQEEDRRDAQPPPELPRNHRRQGVPQAGDACDPLDAGDALAFVDPAGRRYGWASLPGRTSPHTPSWIASHSRSPPAHRRCRRNAGRSASRRVAAPHVQVDPHQPLDRDGHGLAERLDDGEASGHDPRRAGHPPDGAQRGRQVGHRLPGDGEPGLPGPRRTMISWCE